jgi:hypothetical protein
MVKSATDVMQDIIFAAVIDSVISLKTASKGLPNTLLRDLNAIHANTTFADLPKELQTAILESVRSAFTRLRKEGYTVSSSQLAPPVQQPRREPNTSFPRKNRPPPRPKNDGGKKPGDKPNRPRSRP